MNWPNIIGFYKQIEFLKLQYSAVLKKSRFLEIMDNFTGFYWILQTFSVISLVHT